MSAPLPVGPDIWAITVPMGFSHNPHVFSYVVLDAEGAPHLIDSGLDTPDGRAAFDEGLAALGHARADFRSVTLTHFHQDHTGLAAQVRDAGGARVAMHPLDSGAGELLRGVSEQELSAWGVPADPAAQLRAITFSPPPDPPVDVVLEHGALLAIPGRDLRVLHTPGHTAGHICLVSEQERIVFTGDHLLPDQFAGFGLGAPTAANPLVDHRASLAALLPYDGYRALPGHGWAFETIAERVEQALAHHGRRTAEVQAVLAQDPGSSVWEVASQLTWSAGWRNLQGFFRLSALRQTAWHMASLRGNESDS